MVNGRTDAEDMEREYQRAALRDTFAAAALTGLLAQGDDGSFSEESYARAAYRWADTMIRERGNHIADASKMAKTPQELADYWHSMWIGLNSQCVPWKDRTRDVADSVCGVDSGVTVNFEDPVSWLDAIEREYHRVRIELEQLRAKTNHDAAPAARASVGRPRTDKADLPTRCGTGDTPVTEPLPVFASGSGSVTPVSYEKNDEKRVFYDTKSPRNGAPSGCETVPDPDSRVWETPCTPPPHATPPQGSVQGEGSFRVSRNAKEPVAWPVMERDGFGIEVTFTDRDEAAEWCDNRQEIVPLYRHPQPTLTDEEREAVEYFAVIDGPQYLSAANEHAAALRKLLERLA